MTRLKFTLLIRIFGLISCLGILTQACSLIGISNPLPDFNATELALTAAIKTQQALLGTANMMTTRAAGGAIEILSTEASPSETPTVTPSLTPSPQSSPTGTPSPTAVTSPIPTLTIPDPSPDAPLDIPIVPGILYNYFSTTNFVSYGTQLTFKDVVAFYESQMIELFWLKNIPSSYQSANNATLIYEKPDRIARVAIQANPVADMTIVIISIINR